jgi:LysM repeat protein
MRFLRQILPGFFIALLSILVILGGFILSHVEGEVNLPVQTQTSTSTLPTIVTPTREIFTPTAITETQAPATSTFTPPSSPTSCPLPPGWSSYRLVPEDTWDSLAVRYATSIESLLQANCLNTTELVPGTLLFVPPVPTRTSLSCGAPSGWRPYTVQAGETLYRISLAYGITVQQLQNANCMGSSTFIRAGQLLYVPYWATRTPSQIANPTLTPTGTPTFTLTQTETSTTQPSATFTGTSETPSKP